MCAIGVVDPDIGWYLTEWSRFDHPNAAINFRRWLELNAEDLIDGELRNAYWDHRPPVEANRMAIVEWAKSVPVRDFG